jgi:hypothetical protein
LRYARFDEGGQGETCSLLYPLVPAVGSFYVTRTDFYLINFNSNAAIRAVCSTPADMIHLVRLVSAVAIFASSSFTATVKSCLVTRSTSSVAALKAVVIASA